MGDSENARPPRPIFTFAAWFSLLVPLQAAGGAYFVLSGRPPGPAGRDVEHAVFVTLALVCGITLVAGCVSLGGIKSNGSFVILPPAVLGILASLALELLTLFLLLLSGLPGP